MTTQPLNISSFSTKAGSGAARAAIAACAALALSVSSLWADTLGQTEITQFLPTGKTILTANAGDLASAVASAIGTYENFTTPADLADSALEPYPFGGIAAKVRSDRNTAAALVAAAAVDAVISGADANFSTDAAAITDSLADVNNTEAEASKEVLSTAGQTAVVKAALGAISDAIYSGSSPLSATTLLSGDEAIGQMLANDSYLERLTKDGLITILQNAMVGISGAKGKAQTVAPEAAENFVEGLISISGTVPTNSYIEFAVAILKKVSKNTSVDELVAYQIGLKDNASQSALVVLAATLFGAYPNAIVKVAQGITAVVPAVDATEAQRAAFVASLVSAKLKSGASIIEGSTFTDPYFAGEFTTAGFGSLQTAGLLAKDAASIAKDEGAVLGQDGDALTQVADVFGSAIGAGDLPVAKTAAYATDLIKGAVDSKIAASQFTGAAAGGGGGTLNVGAGITEDTMTDLASIVDLLANGIITVDHSTLSGSGLNKAASEVGALAEAVARFTKNELFMDSGQVSQPVAAFLAGTLADSVAATVDNLSLTSEEKAAIILKIDTAIGKGVTAITNNTVDQEVKAAVTAYQDYPVIGAISLTETAVTNL